MTGSGTTRTARVLVTRPEADSEPLVEALIGRGHAVLRQPLLRIVFEDGPAPDLDDAQALLFTSANGVRAFARRSDRRDLPVYAVGDATAEAARTVGFGQVESAGGDVADLAALVRRRCDPGAGVLFHAAGSAIAGDLSGLLGGAGYAVRRVALYRAEKTATLDDTVRKALAGDDVDFGLFFSPRSAAGFATLVSEAGIADSCGGVVAVCLSDAVAAAFGPLAWRRVAVAAEPNQAALLAALDEEVDRDGPMTTESETADSDASGARLSDAAEAVVERFGGIRPMATKLGVPVTTVQGWKNRGHIPDNRHAAIRAAAAAHGVDLTGLPSEPVTAAPAAEAESPPTDTAAEPESKPTAAVSREPDAGGESPPVAEADADIEADAEAGAETAHETAPPPKARGTGAAGWTALVLALLAIAATATQPLWSPIVYRNTGIKEDLTARLAAVEAASLKAVTLSGRLAATDERLAVLIRRIEAAPGVDPAEIAALTGKMDEAAGRARAALDRISQRLGAVEEQVRTPPAEVMAALSELRAGLAALEKSIAAVEARTTALERQPVISGERIAAIAIAAGQLESAVDSGAPYRAALDRLRALARDDTALQEALVPLDANAGKGVATLAALSARFAAIAPRLAVATAEAKGWADRLSEKARALVNMRPVGADGDRSPVTRAERALARRDLPEAVSALATVGGAAVAWRKTAAARVAADRALAAARGRVADMLAREAADSADNKAAAGRAPVK
jgi:uroporphyrinogen-III synthase